MCPAWLQHGRADGGGPVHREGEAGDGGRNPGRAQGPGPDRPKGGAVPALCPASASADWLQVS